MGEQLTPIKWIYYVQESAFALGKVFSCYERFLEMENKGFVIEYWINLSLWDYDYWSNQPVSSCHCSEGRNGNVLNRKDISDAKNSDFRTRFQNDSNVQMRLGKETFMLSLWNKDPRVWKQIRLNLIRPIKNSISIGLGLTTQKLSSHEVQPWQFDWHQSIKWSC